MKVGLVGIHYPRPEHRDEFISRVHQVAEVLAATPGCLEVDCWLSEDNQAVVSTGQWESEQAFAAGAPPGASEGRDDPSFHTASKEPRRHRSVAPHRSIVDRNQNTKRRNER